MTNFLKKQHNYIQNQHVHEQNLGENIFTDKIELKHKRKSGIVKEMRKQLKVNKQAKQEIM